MTHTMNSRAGRSFLFFLILLGRLSAGEWSRWEGVPGEMTADRSTAVVVRSKRDEAGDDMEKGYLFIYELHNQSGTQTAKVSLCFPEQDSATGSWKDIDPNNPTIVHDIRPMEAVTGSRYSPSPRGLNFRSDIKWSEEVAPAASGGGTSEDEEKNPPPGEREEFDGVPLSNTLGLSEAVAKYTDVKARFRAKIVFRIPPGETSWQEIVGEAAVDVTGTWRQQMESWLTFIQRTDLQYYSKLQIVSVTETELTTLCSDLHVYHLLAFLSWNETTPVVLELALLEPGVPPPPEPQPEKIIPANTPEPQPAGNEVPSTGGTSGVLEVSAVVHSGYWLDPDDKDAKAADPVIYVRVAGQAKRVRLSAAKEAYGVPKEAAPDTMSHFSERQGKVTIDRGTHRR